MKIQYLNEGYHQLVALYDERNGGTENFGTPVWDDEEDAWLISCRYADVCIRYYLDGVNDSHNGWERNGWEYGKSGMLYPTALEAYQNRHLDMNLKNKIA